MCRFSLRCRSFIDSGQTLDDICGIFRSSISLHTFRTSLFTNRALLKISLTLYIRRHRHRVLIGAAHQLLYVVRGMCLSFNFSFPRSSYIAYIKAAIIILHALVVFYCLGVSYDCDVVALLLFRLPLSHIEAVFMYVCVWE